MDFGRKASISPQMPAPPGGQLLHAKALPGDKTKNTLSRLTVVSGTSVGILVLRSVGWTSPFQGVFEPCAAQGDRDDHALAGIVKATARLTGCAIERAPRLHLLSEARGIIKRKLRRPSAIEAVIGHMKTDGYFGRCFLKGRDGDAANVNLGYAKTLIITPSAQLGFLTDD